MRQEETLFKATYDFMRKRGYKITKNSNFNVYKTDIMKFTAYPDCTTISSYLHMEEYDFEDFIKEEDVIEFEEEEKDSIRRYIKEYDSLTDENRDEYDYCEEDIKQIEIFRKYL
jgi:hypothetical protein